MGIIKGGNTWFLLQDFSIYFYTLNLFLMMFRCFGNRKVLALVLCLLMVALSFAKKDTLTVGYYNSPPFTMTSSEGKVHGVSEWVWHTINKENDSIYYKYVNFSDDENPLVALLNGLKNNTIDVSLTPLTIIPERNKYMQFTQPFYISNLTVVVPKTSAFDKAVTFINTFVSKTFLITVFILFLIMFVFGVLVWAFEQKNKTSDFSKGYKGVFNSIWWSAVTMTTVGYGDMTPKTLGGRIVALIWMFAGIIIVSGFTASITTSLTVSRLDKNANTLDAFKDKRVGTVKGSATDMFLTAHFFRNKQLAPQLTEGLYKLQQGETEAFVFDEPSVKYQLNKNPDFKNLKVTNLRFNVDFYAFAFSKAISSKLVTAFSRKIIAMRKSKDWAFLLKEYDLSEI